jgi:hypothetical protein
MATAKNTRAAKARSVDRHPNARHEPADPTDARAESPAAILRDIRRRLEVLMSVVYLASAILRHQNADETPRWALALRQCVGDEIGRQIDRIDAALGQ